MILKASQEPSLAVSASWTLKGDSLATSSTRDRGKLNALCGAISKEQTESEEQGLSYYSLLASNLRHASEWSM